MPDFDNRLQWTDKFPPIVGSILLLFSSFVGFVVIGQVIGLAIGALMYGDATAFLNDMSQTPMVNGELQLPLMVVQGIASGVGFIVFPVLFMIFYERQTINVFFNTVQVNQRMLWLIPLIGFVFMGFNAIFVEWNANLSFPEAMSGFESWAREFEDRAMVLTEYLTTFNSRGMFILGFTVIAIIPGIGEELVFRGFLQNYLHRSSKNIHIAIWVSAFLFSAMHMQLFGFIPRMLLGALFGYLYYWSGNLIVPVIAHIFNNGFTVAMMYLHQQNIVDIDVQSTESVPLVYVGISGLFIFILLFYFRKISLEQYQRQS